MRMIDRRVPSTKFIASILAALGLFTMPALAAETLKIGVMGPMSGGAAIYGIEMANAAKIRADEINAAGGLKVGNQTYTIEIIPYDHKADAAEARTIANRLVFEDKVKFIIGNAIGATTTAAQTVTEPNGVLFTFTSWGIKNLGPDKPLSFRSELSALEVVEPFYSWIKEKHPNIKRIAQINPNDESGRDSSSVADDVAKKLGFEMVADEFFPRDTKDFYPLLTRIIALKPDYIDLADTPDATAALIAKQLAELGYKGAKGWVAGANPDTLVKIAGKEAAEGTWVPWLLNYNGPETSPQLKALVAAYQKKYNAIPGSTGIANYVSLDVVTKAMEQTGSLDPKVIADKMATGTFTTVWGALVVGGESTYHINRQFLRSITISEIKNGEIVAIGTSLPAELKKK